MSEEDRPPPEESNFLTRAEAEIKAMGKEGWEHPSTQPVLLGAFIGGLLGSGLSGVGFFLGALLGGLVALYIRLQPKD